MNNKPDAVIIAAVKGIKKANIKFPADFIIDICKFKRLNFFKPHF